MVYKVKVNIDFAADIDERVDNKKRFAWFTTVNETKGKSMRNNELFKQTQTDEAYLKDRS